MSRSEKILIVDDDRALSGMLSELLQTEGYDCTVAHNGHDALIQERTTKPDLVILDVMMPGEDGIATLARLRQHSRVAVLMLTAMGEDEDRVSGFEAGADDYLAKPFVPRELVLRIKAILRRVRASSAANSDQVLNIDPLMIEPARDRAQLNGMILPLTGAELRVLHALASAVGQVVSREQLTRTALGRELTPYDRALDTHISHLRRKLDDTSPDAGVEIRSVRGAGYRLVID